MKKANELTKKLIEMAANTMIDKDSDEWPPECVFFTYQPKRPERAENRVDDAISNT